MADKERGVKLLRIRPIWCAVASSSCMIQLGDLRVVAFIKSISLRLCCSPSNPTSRYVGGGSTMLCVHKRPPGSTALPSPSWLYIQRECWVSHASREARTRSVTVRPGLAGRGLSLACIPAGTFTRPRRTMDLTPGSA